MRLCTVFPLVLLAGLSCGKGGGTARRQGAPGASSADAAAALRGVGSLRLARIQAAVVGWPEEGGPPPRQEVLEEKLAGRLTATGLFALAGPGQADGPPSKLRMEVALGLVGDDRKAPKIRGMLLLQVKIAGASPEEDGTLEENLISEVPMARSEQGIAEQCTAFLSRMLDDAVRGLAAKEKIRLGDRDAVREALGGSDPLLFRAALSSVAAHGLKELVPNLISLLGSEDPAVRDGAIGALVEMRERTAVAALTGLAKFGDLDTMRRIIDAIGTIGGDEAHSYLEFVAQGHGHPAIRELAQKALQHLEDREKNTGRQAGE
ncbi:MAG: HEAT repeat domain-containing protein [Deltaproteobacteria bacterium]|nr:HEAT repeat domain-containing protein [Deltaproteobacteria bacterium]